MATMFLDMRAAYYRVIREVATGDIRCDATVAFVLKRFGLGGEEAHDLMQLIKEGGAMRDAGVSSAICSAVGDFHYRTWFISMNSSGDKLCSTLAGSRPGESWADALFSYVFARVLCRIMEIAEGEELLSYHSLDEEAGIFANPEAGTSCEARDTTWADDVALPLSDPDPDRLIRKAQRFAALVLSHCESFGLEPNLKRGKTSLLLVLQGKGSQQAKARYSRRESRPWKFGSWVRPLLLSLPIPTSVGLSMRLLA